MNVFCKIMDVTSGSNFCFIISTLEEKKDKEENVCDVNKFIKKLNLSPRLNNKIQTNPGRALWFLT